MGRGSGSNAKPGVDASLAKPTVASALSGVAVSHGRQQENAKTLKDAQERVATGLGLRDSVPLDPNCVLLGSQEDTIESVAVSQTLGTTDTIVCPPGVRENAPLQHLETTSYVSESEASGDGTPRTRHVPPAQKASFVSLFAGNRQASNGCKLDEMEVGDGPVQFLDSDVEDVLANWNFCLVGYFGGRFPGREALQKITSAWKVPVLFCHVQE